MKLEGTIVLVRVVNKERGRSWVPQVRWQCGEVGFWGSLAIVVVGCRLDWVGRVPNMEGQLRVSANRQGHYDTKIVG